MNKREAITTKRCETPCGPLLLGAVEDRIVICDWLDGGSHDRVAHTLFRRLNADFEEGTTPVLEIAIAQLDEYFGRQRKAFDLPRLYVGTDFQRQVWKVINAIPYGMTITYGELARKIGRPSSVRAVANATGANPMSILTPCHRVIGSDGTLTGYGGSLPVKNYLLKLEQKISSGICHSFQ